MMKDLSSVWHGSSSRAWPNWPGWRKLTGIVLEGWKVKSVCMLWQHVMSRHMACDVGPVCGRDRVARLTFPTWLPGARQTLTYTGLYVCPTAQVYLSPPSPSRHRPSSSHLVSRTFILLTQGPNNSNTESISWKRTNYFRIPLSILQELRI